MSAFHGEQTTADGVHILVRWEFVSAVARDAASYTVADVGGIARVGGSAPYTFSILTNDTGPVFGDVGAGGGGTGDVSGPGASTDNALARWNGTDGESLQDSGSSTPPCTLTDGGLLTVPGLLVGGVTTSTLKVTTGAGTLGDVLTADASGNATWVVPVSGPGSSTDDALVRWGDTTGKTLKDSGSSTPPCTLTDGGLLTVPGLAAGSVLALQVETGDLKVTGGMGTAGDVLTSSDAFGNVSWVVPVSGPGPGPGTSTDDALVRWNGTDGTSLQDSPSPCTLSDGGLLTVSGLAAGSVLALQVETGDLKVTTGAGTLGDVLTADASGNATWQTPTGGTSETVKVDFLYSDASPVTIATLNTGDVLLNLWMRYETDFDDPSASTNIDVGATNLVDVFDTDVTDVTNAWHFNPVYYESAGPTSLTLTITPGASATQGGGFVVVMIHRA